jgi:hypothetical protein
MGEMIWSGNKNSARSAIAPGLQNCLTKQPF